METLSNVKPLNLTILFLDLAIPVYVVILCLKNIRPEQPVIPQAPYIIKYARKKDYIIAWLSFLSTLIFIFICIIEYFRELFY